MLRIFPHFSDVRKRVPHNRILWFAIVFATNLPANRPRAMWRFAIQSGRWVATENRAARERHRSRQECAKCTREQSCALIHRTPPSGAWPRAIAVRASVMDCSDALRLPPLVCHPSRFRSAVPALRFRNSGCCRSSACDLPSDLFRFLLSAFCFTLRRSHPPIHHNYDLSAILFRFAVSYPAKSG